MRSRGLNLPASPKRFFFLWGPLQARRGLLRERIWSQKSKFVIIDEVQKVRAIIRSYFEVLSVSDFTDRLWAGGLIG